MYFYYVIFIVLLGMYLLGEYCQRVRPALLLFAATLLVLVAAFRGEGVDKDYLGYIDLFNEVVPLSYYFSNISALLIKDPAFTLISSVIKYSLNDQVVYLFVIFSILGVSLQVFAIKRMSDFWLLSILLYFSNYFLLHEMTQIRIGVACGFLLLSIPSIVDRKPTKYLMYVAAAACFHYSALIILPLYFLDPKKLNTSLYLLVLILPMLLTLTKLSLHPVFSMLGQDNPLTQRYYNYLYHLSQGELAKPNLFNVIILFNALLGLLFILKWPTICVYNKYSVIIIKIHVFSVVVFYLFYDVGVFAFRFMEVLNVVQILLIPLVIHVFKEKRAATLGVIICALTLLSFNLYYTQLLESYLK